MEKLKKVKENVQVKLNLDLNQEQKSAKGEILNNKITYLTGKSGSGKTLLSCEIALNMLFKKQITKIIIARPAVEAGEKLGALPGDLKDKLDPYVQSMYRNFYRLYKKELIEKYVEEGKIEIIPFAYMRGLTFINSFIIVDEVQNCSIMQTKMALERLGQGSKMVLCGDLDQVDIPSSKSGVKFLDYLNKKEVVGFSKIVLKTNHRDEIVEDILNVYNEFKEENGIH
jgi:phosphate starvation-inducible PhoH-like protein